MAAGYDEAVDELYQAPHEAFVAERKRLSAALKAGGDKAGAARLVKLGRPPLSAWAVNQLWWQAGDQFARLLAAAQRLRAGDQSASAERRDALATLKGRAASILVQAGHGANEGTLRRVATTLAALAASGGFEPDPPGALAADRDPPGFDVAALGGIPAQPPSPPAPRAVPAPAPESTARARPALRVVPPPRPEAAPDLEPSASAGTSAAEPTEPRASEHERAEQERLERERIERQQAEHERLELERIAREQTERIERERVEQQRAEHLRIERDRKRLEAERAARAAERQRLEQSLPALRGDLERRRREVERLKTEVERVEGLAEQARAALATAEERLAALPDDG
jgi:DNA repair exonuclease SbcCD ATPase subunit